MSLRCDTDATCVQRGVDGGLYRMPSCEPGWWLVFILSSGLGWENVSVRAARPHPGFRPDTSRVPTWREMCLVKAACWDPDDVVIQLHPARRDYINIHPLRPASLAGARSGAAAPTEGVRMSTTTRTRCRAGARCQPASLKEALDCLGHHGDLTVAQLAERLGHISEGTLGKQLSQYDEDNYPTLRHVIPLTRASGSDALIRYLAEACGGVFFRVPSVSAALDVSAIATIVREFGELLEEVSRATADGRVTDDELTRVRREANDVITAIAAYVERLHTQVSEASATCGPRRTHTC